MNRESYLEKFDTLYNKVKDILESAPGCHDFDHTERVLHNARMLAEKEKDADIRIVELASLLHDIARPEEMEAKGKICHARRGAEEAPGILKECGFDDPQMIRDISESIRRHRYRDSEHPESIEQKIVYDADKLDSIGAVGIGRAFHFAGRIGAKLHNTKEAALASRSYSEEDSAYREYLVKLHKIPGKMLTDTGRKIAEKRAEFMKIFFDTINDEIYG